MVTSNKDAANIWAEIEKARNITPKEERGANDLERRIDDLQKINDSHKKLNGELRADVLFYKKKAEHFEVMAKQLKKENEEFRRKSVDFFNEFRNKGDL